jgi:hypothetical protein
MASAQLLQISEDLLYMTYETTLFAAHYCNYDLHMAIAN